MSTSPLPPDPYEALGVSRDCDTDAVKKAHRKLVLKHHPDRIKDPALVEAGKNEFQKVQQAYELLVDSARRQRYDDEVKLMQLRKERAAEMASMSNEPPRAMYTKTTYTTRSAPAPTQPVQREYRPEPRYAYEYEEREPDSPYCEPTPRGFDAQIPRANAKKVDSRTEGYDRRSSAATKPAERKEKPRPSGWEKPVAGMSMRMAFGMKGAAQAAKAKVKEKEKEKEVKEKEKETHARNAKARDKEEQRARDQKQTFTRPPASYVEDDLSESDTSSSDSDTVIGPRRPVMRERSPVHKARRSLTPEPMSRTKRVPSPRPEVRASRQQSPRPIPKASRQPSPRPEPKASQQASPRPEQRSRQPSPRPDSRSVYDEDSHDDEKYERQFRKAQGYQYSAAQKEGRPPLSRQGSDIREYWQAEPVRDKKSGSDSDKRPSTSSKSHRRSVQDEPKIRPSLHPQSSAPAGVRQSASTLERESFSSPRSRQTSYSSGNHRKEMPPELKRSGSEPMPPKAPTKRDSLPVKGSGLKQSETNHDSGYGSSSNPQTPENRGESPQRPPLPRETSTRYRVGKDEDAPRARRVTTDSTSQYLSPPEQPHHHHHHHHTESKERHPSRSRERESDGRHHRSSSSRPERRPSLSRNESSSRYDDRGRDREKPRTTRMEKSPDRSYFRQWQEPVRQSRPKAPTFQGTPSAKFASYEDPTLARSPYTRRPSVY